MTRPAKILICDDHPIILLALRSELMRAGFSVAEPVSTVSATLAALSDPELRLVVTDFSFNEAGDGLQLLERMCRLRPDVGVIVYSRIKSSPMVQDIMAAGAKAFVSKTCGIDRVIMGCRSALIGRPFIAPESLADLVEQSRKDVPKTALQRLSPREREVLRLLAQGLSVAEIGRRFRRSPKTVSVQKCSGMSKLGLSQDMDLARYLATTDWSDTPGHPHEPRALTAATYATA